MNSIGVSVPAAGAPADSLLPQGGLASCHLVVRDVPAVHSLPLPPSLPGTAGGKHAKGFSPEHNVATPH